MIARPGDLLVLTKPLGTGIISTAIKGEMIAEKEAAMVTGTMAALNAAAAKAMLENGVLACTDVTGFSLLGHLHEMLVSSSVSAVLEFEKIPLYPRVKEMAAMGMIPAGAYRNLDYLLPHINWQGPVEVKDDALMIMADPQTSGGLLVALAPDKIDSFLTALETSKTLGQVIGRITDGPQNTITIS